MFSKNTIRKKYLRINHSLNEKTRRLWCAAEALAIGDGGVALVHKATKVSRSTIYEGIQTSNKNNVVKNQKDESVKKVAVQNLLRAKRQK